jgi:integrase
MDRDTLLRRFEAEYQELHSVSQHRRDIQMRVLNKLADSLDGRPLDELTAQDVATFFGAELHRGLHPNSVRTYMGMVRSFITWADQAGVIAPEVSAHIKSVRNPRGSTGRSQPNPYTISEVRTFHRLLAERYPALPEHGRGSRLLPRLLTGKSDRMGRHLLRHAKRLQFEAQIALALECGLRMVEIHRLNIAAMHYDNDQVVVLSAKKGPGASALNAKRVVPYPSHARACVQEWLDFRFLLKPDHEVPWLMLDYIGRLDEQIVPQTYRAMSRSLDRFPGDWGWHRFRHTAATEWLRSGVPLEKVSRFMGHTTLEQTRAYTKITEADVSDAFGKAEEDFARRLGLAA